MMKNKWILKNNELLPPKRIATWMLDDGNIEIHYSRSQIDDGHVKLAATLMAYAPPMLSALEEVQPYLSALPLCVRQRVTEVLDSIAKDVS